MGEHVVRRVKEMRGSSGNDDGIFLRGEVLARVGDKLLTTCLEAGSRDNMSVLIVAFLCIGPGLHAHIPLKYLIVRV